MVPVLFQIQKDNFNSKLELLNFQLIDYIYFPRCALIRVMTCRMLINQCVCLFSCVLIRVMTCRTLINQCVCLFSLHVKCFWLEFQKGIWGNQTMTPDILALVQFTRAELYILNNKIQHMINAWIYPVVVAEWLRRWTRNPLGYSRAGSNPADNVWFVLLFLSGHSFYDCDQVCINIMIY